MNDLITYLILPTIALLLGVGAVGGIAIATGITIRWKQHAFAVILFLIALASISIVLLSGRRLVIGTDGLENVGEAMTSGLSGKLMLISVIGCAVALCAARLFDMNGKISADTRLHRRGLSHPVDITVAFMVFYVAFSILPFFFSPDHFFHIRLIYPFFVYLAIFLWLPLTERDPVWVLKWATGLFVFSSLLMAIVAPQSAIQPGYSGLIPGFNIRLWGTTAHANSLGAVVCGYILFEIAQPVRRRWLHLLLMSLALVTLVLAQSKTAIICVIIGGGIMYGLRLWNYLDRKGRDYDGQGGQILALLIALACVFTLIVAAWIMFGEGNLLKSIERRLDPAAVSTLSSGTGRVGIWAAAIDAGLENPLFGQGNDFWNAATRQRLGMSGAITAHNQYLQVFALSGLVGLAALLVFMGYLILYAIRGARASGGATIAMLAVLIIRSLTEVPIAPNAVLAAEFLATTGFILFIMDRGVRARSGTRKHSTAPVVRQTGTRPRPVRTAF